MINKKVVGKQKQDNYLYDKNKKHNQLRNNIFEFTSADIYGRVISLRYKLTGGPNPDIEFEEKIELPEEIPEPDPRDPVVQELLDGIHRVFGVSYFKTAVPPHIVAPPVTEQDALFWDTLYTEGLGEFWYRNNLDPTGRVHFPRGENMPVRTTQCLTEDRVFVLVGGGKDSAVAREIVRHAGIQADALSLGNSEWQRRSVSAMDLRHIVIRRSIDPKLFELNRQGALNGHIPISACIAFISMLVSYVGGYSSVVAANERSAYESNLIWHGISVNHQWSKSLQFEESFQNWCDRRFLNGPRYFSILRTMGELSIAEMFTRHPAYFDRFASCNANFRHLPGTETPRWCGNCPKCVFVQLMLAPYLSNEVLLNIFGRDFLSDQKNHSIIEALVGIRGFKPFECVGTIEESRAALARLANKGQLHGYIYDWYVEHVTPIIGDADDAWEKARLIYGSHRIPKIWQERLHAYL